MAKPKTTLPAWFDEKRHGAGDGGIYETATGTLLGDDGQPVSAAVQLARAAHAAVEAEGATAAAAATKAATPVLETPIGETPIAETPIAETKE